MTAFLLFSNAMRAAVKAESPGIDFGEVSKILGEKWARICAKEKAEYEAKAAEDKDRYLREMQEYASTKSDSESEARSPSGKKHKGGHVKASAAQAYAQEWRKEPAVESARLGGNERKASGAPKKPMTPFLHFSNAVRESVKAENPGIAFGELAKVIGEKWAKLSAQEKAEYVKRFDEDKQRYAREMQDYALAREGAAGSGSAAADAPIRVEEETTEEEDETDVEEEEEEEEEKVEEEEEEEEQREEEYRSNEWQV
eukprot:XP_001697394.1 high mobility group protein [Chlamydomonas reinhardtii]